VREGGGGVPALPASYDEIVQGEGVLCGGAVPEPGEQASQLRVLLRSHVQPRAAPLPPVDVVQQDLHAPLFPYEENSNLRWTCLHAPSLEAGSHITYLAAL